MATDLFPERTERGRSPLPADGDRVVASLSPSRAADFMTCPLLYRFRVLDRLPEAPSQAAVRGTVVHSVLERLFDLPAPERTPQAAHTMVARQWERLVGDEPELAQMFAGADGDAVGSWLAECRTLLDLYFQLEDPSRLEPVQRELYVEHVLESGLLLRGYIDRVDVNAAGAVRVVDYKTGRAPSELFEAKALFQMKFYALVLWRSSGRIPDLLQLVYLGNGEVLRYAPHEQDLVATERKVNAVWDAIARATMTGRWLPRRSAMCGWCDHQALCPEWGGTPPPLPGGDDSPCTAGAARDITGQ